MKMPIARRAFWVLVAVAVLIAQTAIAATAANWLQYRRDNQRSGFNAYETRVTPVTAGSLDLTRVIGFPFHTDWWNTDAPTSPVIYRGVLYTVAASYIHPEPWMDSPNPSDVFTLYALNASTGRVLWSRDLGCDAPSGIPAISVADNVIVVPLSTGCGSQTGGGYLVAIDLTTHLPRWSQQEVEYGTPAIVGGNVFIASGFDDTVSISSIDVGTGQLNWQTDADGTFGNPAVGWGVVYARECTWGGTCQLTALDAGTGARLWSKGTATGDPTVTRSRVLVQCAEGTCAYDRNGDLKWTVQGAARVAVANGRAYASCDTTVLCSLDVKSGAPFWSTTAVAEGPMQIDSVLVAGGVVYASRASAYPAGTLAFDAATGAQLSLDTFGPPTSDPVVVNGRVYFAYQNRIYIYSVT